MNYRARRLEQELKEEISTIVSQELRDPRMGFVTITAVEASPDLKYARVLVSAFGEKQEKQKTFEALESAKGFIRRQIGARIKLRHTPELTFVPDESIERGDQMMRLIEEIKKEIPESAE